MIVEIALGAVVLVAALVLEVRRLRAFARDLDERWRDMFMSL